MTPPPPNCLHFSKRYVIKFTHLLFYHKNLELSECFSLTGERVGVGLEQFIINCWDNDAPPPTHTHVKTVSHSRTVTNWVKVWGGTFSLFLCLSVTGTTTIRRTTLSLCAFNGCRSAVRHRTDLQCRSAKCCSTECCSTNVMCFCTKCEGGLFLQWHNRTAWSCQVQFEIFRGQHWNGKQKIVCLFWNWKKLFTF